MVHEPTRRSLHDRNAALAVVRLVRVMGSRLEGDGGAVSALAPDRQLWEVDRLERALLADEVALADLAVEAVAAEPLVGALRVVDGGLVEARDGVGGRRCGTRCATRCARSGGRGRGPGVRLRGRGRLLLRGALLARALRGRGATVAAAAAGGERDRDQGDEQEGAEDSGRDPTP